MSSNREDLAAVAGFYNGEGCCLIARHRDRKGDYAYQSLKLTITNTNLHHLEWCRSIIGGVIYKKPIGKSRKQAYELSFQGFEKVQAVIAALWFKLSWEKQDQAWEALSDWQIYRRKLVDKRNHKPDRDTLPILRRNNAR